MAIAHLCQDCGTDLARVRAVPEPHYGLPLVVCPSCGGAWVRRRHPLAARWRQMLRIDVAIRALGVQLAIAATLMSATLVAIPGSWLALVRLRAGYSPGEPALVLSMTLVVLPIVIGGWLTAGFSHVSLRRAWLGWSISVAAVGGIAAALIVTFAREVITPGGFVELELMSVSERIRTLGVVVGSSAPVLGLMMFVALVGVPIGRLGRLIANEFRSWRWSTRRRRLRLGKIVP